MTTELWLLFWSLPLYGLYLGAQALIYRAHYGYEFAATARDNPGPEGPLLGRAERALKNFQETWPIFISLALIGHLAMQGEPLMFWGALVWFAARLIYLPLYLFGVFLVRSLVWTVSLIGLIIMGWPVLF
jgi:uncharacterized MAPEG superfamily protein